jgi:hypothetical protein
MAKGPTFTVEKASEGWNGARDDGGAVTEGATKVEVVRQTVGLVEESGSIKIKGRRGRSGKGAPIHGALTPSVPKAEA